MLEHEKVEILKRHINPRRVENSCAKKNGNKDTKGNEQ